MQCTAKSKRTGEQCRGFAVKGKTKCRMHGGKNEGAPKNNKNAIKHGAYEAISLATMSVEEIEYANTVSLSPIDTLKEQLKTLRVKESRVAIRLKKAKEDMENAGKNDGATTKTPLMVTIDGTNSKQVNAMGEESKSYSTSSETQEMHFLRIDHAHSVVLEQIRRVSEAIAKIEGDVVDDESLNEPVIIEIVDARKKKA